MKKLNIKIVACMAALAIALSPAAYAADGTKARVNIDGGSLNVREGSGTDYLVKDSLYAGDELIIMSEENGWAYVSYGKEGGQTGWVSLTYLDKSAQGELQYGSVGLAVNDYKQYDTRWAARTLGSSPYTVRTSGCTLTCYAMSEEYRRGETYTPLSALTESRFTASGALYWTARYERWYGENYLEKIHEKISEGTPVLIESKTSSGGTHWAIVTGYTEGDAASAESFTINDPGSETRKTLKDYLDVYPYYSKLVYYDY